MWVNVVGLGERPSNQQAWRRRRGHQKVLWYPPAFHLFLSLPRRTHWCAPGVCLNKLAELLPEIVGGSADLNPSTLTYLTCSKDFQKNTPEGRNIRFGVREHGMAGT